MSPCLFGLLRLCIENVRLVCYASCQIHIISHKALNLSHSSFDLFNFTICGLPSVLRDGKACDLNYNKSETELSPPPVSSPHCLPAWPVNVEPSIEAHRLGVGIFFFFFFSFLPIFILTLWKTRRPSSSTAILCPWLFPF